MLTSCSCSSGHVVVWDIATKRPLTRFQARAPSAGVLGVQPLAAGNALLT